MEVAESEYRLARPVRFYRPSHPLSGSQHSCVPHLLPYGENKVKSLRRVGSTEDEREEMREKVVQRRKEGVRGKRRKKVARRDLHLNSPFK